MDRFTGGCLCGDVRIVTSGLPYRVGVCHCLDCRKHHGALFSRFRDIPSRGGDDRWRNARLRSPVFLSSLRRVGLLSQRDEIAVNLGSLDAPDQLRPSYELWTVRRESWLPSFALSRRYDRDRDATGRFEE